MKKIKIENQKIQTILRTMFVIYNSPKAKEAQSSKSNKEKKYLYQVIYWDSEKKNLVATNNIILLIYNVTEKSLINALGSEDGYFLGNGIGNALTAFFEASGRTFPPYRSLLKKYKYEKYVEIDQVKQIYNYNEKRNYRNFDLLLELSVYTSGSLFYSDSFDILSNLEFNSIWFDDTKDKICRPVRLKNNKERILAMVMPLIPEKIEIKTKT